MSTVDASEVVGLPAAAAPDIVEQMKPLIWRMLAITRIVMGGLVLLLAIKQIAFGVPSYQGLVGGICVSDSMLKNAILSETDFIFLIVGYM